MSPAIGIRRATAETRCIASPSWSGENAMRLSRVYLLRVLLAGWFVVPLHAQTSAPGFTAGEERPEDFPEGPGRDETFYACVACHNFKLVAAQGMGRQQW